MKTLAFATLLLVQSTGAVPQVQTGAVTGRVLATDGSPAAKVRVSASPIPAAGITEREPLALTATSETNADGSYRLTDVPPGRYLILAGLLDSPTYYPGVRTLSAAMPIDVVAGKTVSGIDLRVEKISSGLTVSGRVRRESTTFNNAGMQVSLSGGDQFLNAPPKADGSFEFLKVRPGNYSLSIPAPGFQPLAITVTDRDVTGLDLVIPWTTEIAGRVVVDGNGLIPAFSLVFSSPSFGTATASQARQTFRMTLTEGAYGIAASGIPSGYSLKSIMAGNTDLLRNPLRITKTTAPPEIVVTLGVSTPPPWVTVSGRIIGRRPSQGERLTISLNNFQIQAEPINADVHADGSFGFSRVLPGSYAASLQPMASTTNSFTLVVPNRDLTDIELAAPGMKEVSGSIVVEEGGLLPRVTLSVNGAPGVTIVSKDPTPGSAELFVTPTRNVSNFPTQLGLNVQSDGSFKVALPEGEYRLAIAAVNVNASASPYTLKSFTYGAADLLNNAIVVSSADSAELRLTYGLDSASARKVSGRVEGWDPARLTSTSGASPASVSLFNPFISGTLSATIRPDGSFEFPKVYPGDYTANLSGAIPNLAIRPTATLHVGNADVTGVNLVIPRQREIPGRVMLEGEGFIPRFTIPLIGGSPGNLNSRPVSSESLFITPQRDGTFKVSALEGERAIGVATGLPPGYTIKSMMYGTVDLTKDPLKVLATDTAELRITLTAPDAKPVRVSGRVEGWNPATLPTPAALRTGPGALGGPPPSTVVLSTSYSFSTLSAVIGADGSFEFPKVYPADYTARLEGLLPALAVQPTANVHVGDADVTVNLVLPRQRQIPGRITLEGEGLLPRFTIPLIGADPDNPRSLLLPFSINPQADGAFKVVALEGEHAIGAPTGLPPGYTIKSMMYGTVDLTKDPLQVLLTDTAELRITLTAPNVKPVRVSGRVEGWDAARPVPTPPATPPAVSLSSSFSSTSLSAPIAADGSFEFPKVYPGDYTTVLTLPNMVVRPTATVHVADADVIGVSLVLPRQREIPGRVIMEGVAPIQRFTIPFRTSLRTGNLPISSVPLNINPQPDGTFKVVAPEGEGSIGAASNLPAGYAIKSIMYGTLDVTNSPFKVLATDTGELRITLTGPARSFKVSGRVEGLDPLSLSQGAARITLSSQSVVALFATVHPDGAFEFPTVFPGTYIARLTAPAAAGFNQLPKTIPVTNADLKDVVLVVPGQRIVTGRVVVEGGPAITRIGLRITASSSDGRNSAMTAQVNLAPDGAFRVTLPAVPEQLGVTGLPEGYSLKSLLYGDTDLQRKPLDIGSADRVEELRIVVEKSAAPATSDQPQR
jgi:hypothetical protein